MGAVEGGLKAKPFATWHEAPVTTQAKKNTAVDPVSIVTCSGGAPVTPEPSGGMGVTVATTDDEPPTPEPPFGETLG
jgi:hypothetical protein